MKAKLAAMLLCVTVSGAERAGKPPRTALDRYIEEAMNRPGPEMQAAPGAIWFPGARFADLARDVRAAQVDDIVTILVAERASALARGATKTARASSASASVAALGGITKARGPLANLADLGGESQLNGEGATSRETVLSTTLAARVTHVLPNGYLVIEGAKEVQVNAERQTVVVRGVIRPEDLSPGNVIRSDRIAQLEVRVNGKGVVADAVRRPFFLYRLLVGLLPF
ncbi:MAG: flagellar basal body L-ring protein FlgH [Bryobacteraceae bacterium]|nr:flagellar basal body L-ring protein FlgH [Bryobacteraceae bacterium]